MVLRGRAAAISAREAWWFVAQRTEVLAFGESLQLLLRIPALRPRFSYCPVFLAPDASYIFISCVEEKGGGVFSVFWGLGGGFTTFLSNHR